MREPQERYRDGLHYLDEVTVLLQRIRSAHPTAGLYEAADLQWWWAQKRRSTDERAQLFWFDDLGQPEAAVIANSSGGDVGGEVQLDPIVMPDATPEFVAHVMERGLAHVYELGFETVSLEVDRGDSVLQDVLLRNGFVNDGVAMVAMVETWLAADARPEICTLHDGYRLSSRSESSCLESSGLESSQLPHHMIKRTGPDVEARLHQTSLYRADLDLTVYDGDNNIAAYGLFWYDPATATGLVEPMRTEDDHQRKGLARHILTAGIELLANAGAQRIKICFEPTNPASSHLYLSSGFVPDRHTVRFTGPTGRNH
jgi:GNAT superfamily N-acetyltransferase